MEFPPNCDTTTRDCHVASLLAMTDLGGPKGKGHPTVFEAHNHRTVLCNDLPFPVIARSAVRHDEAISLRGFPTLGCSPMFVIARKDEVLTKQSLFVSTFGSAIQMRPRAQRLPRALTGPRNDSVGGVALAMTTHGHVRHTASLFCVKSFLFCSYPGMNRNVSQFFWGFERIPLFPVNFYLFTIPIGSSTRIISFQKYVIYFFYIPSP